MEKNTKLKLWTEWMFEEYFPDVSQEKYLAGDLETCDINLLTHGSGWATGSSLCTYLSKLVSAGFRHSNWRY